MDYPTHWLWLPWFKPSGSSRLSRGCRNRDRPLRRKLLRVGGVTITTVQCPLCSPSLESLELDHKKTVLPGWVERLGAPWPPGAEFGPFITNDRNRFDLTRRWSGSAKRTRAGESEEVARDEERSRPARRSVITNPVLFQNARVGETMQRCQGGLAGNPEFVG